MTHSWRSPSLHGVWLAALLSWAVFLGTSRLQAADAPASPFVAKTLRPFLDQHCVGCHGGGTKKGGLDLENLRIDLAGPKNFETWVKVHDKVRAPVKCRRGRNDGRPRRSATRSCAACEPSW